jgi:hypothetical protein
MIPDELIFWTASTEGWDISMSQKRGRVLTRGVERHADLCKENEIQPEKNNRKGRAYHGRRICARV